MMDISAVIPCYNGAEFIETALDSIAAQNYPVREIIVVDDGSTDDSLKQVENWRNRHPDLSVEIIAQPNQGVAIARNTGWKAAKSPWIAFLDADDIWYANHNEILVQSLTDENSVLVFCDANRAERDGDQELPLPTFFEMADIGDLLGQHASTHHIGGPIHQRLLTGSFVPTCSNLVRKTALEDIQGFEKGRAYGEDRQAWLRLFALGPVNVSTEIVGRQLYHGNNATHSRHAIKELKARLDLLLELTGHASSYKLGSDEIGILNNSYSETLDNLKYTLSLSGIASMIAEGESLKRHGTTYSVKDIARGVVRSFTS